MPDNYSRTNNICLVFLTLCAATMALIYTKTVMIPLIFSVFAYSILTPIVNWIQKKTKVPKGLAIFFSLILLYLVLTLIVIILISSVENFVQGAPKYKESLAESLKWMESQLTRFNVNLELNKLTELVQSGSFLSFAQKLGGQLLGFLGNLFLVFIFVMFMMTGETTSQEKSPLLKEILAKISAYVSTKAITSLSTGFLVWMILLFFGVELAFIFGLLTVLLNFIPTIGSILAVLLPLPVVFLQYQLSFDFFLILGLTGAVQITIGNIIEPKFMGDTMELHPIMVMVGLIFWGVVWGIPGMFLAVPITASLKIVFKKLDATKDFAEIMAGRLPS
jgi:AI-2 transport protein TqsA